MELLETLYYFFVALIKEFSTIQGGLQLVTVLGCGAMAALTHKRWQQFITRLLGNLEQQ